MFQTQVIFLQTIAGDIYFLDTSFCNSIWLRCDAPLILLCILQQNRLRFDYSFEVSSLRGRLLKVFSILVK